MKTLLTTLLVTMLLSIPSFSANHALIREEGLVQDKVFSPINLKKAIKALNNGDQTYRDMILNKIYNNADLLSTINKIDLTKLFPSSNFSKFNAVEMKTFLTLVCREYIPLSQDFVDAVTIRAIEGDAMAQYISGFMYDNGIGTNIDVHTAFNLYKKAATQNCGPAQYILGISYFHGHRIAKNLPKAFKWFNMAAQQGCMQAQYNLALMYYQGHGIPENLPEAFKWFSKAAQQGFMHAQYCLALMYTEDRVIPRNLSAAFKWFRKSAEQGHIEAQAIITGSFKASPHVSQRILLREECQAYMTYFNDNLREINEFFTCHYIKANVSGFKDAPNTHPFLADIYSSILNSIKDYRKVVEKTEKPEFLVSAIAITDTDLDFLSHLLAPYHSPFIAWRGNTLFKRIKRKELLNKIQALNTLIKNSLTILQKMTLGKDLLEEIIDITWLELKVDNEKILEFIKVKPKTNEQVAKMIDDLKERTLTLKEQQRQQEQSFQNLVINWVSNLVSPSSPTEISCLEKSIKLLENINNRYQFLNPFFDGQPKTKEYISDVTIQLKENISYFDNYEEIIPQLHQHLIDFLVKTKGTRNALFKEKYPWLFT